MRLSVTSRLPMPGSANYQGQLNAQLYRLLEEFARQVNQITEGQVSAVTNAAAAAPTAGTFAQGDFVRNSAPTELGSVSSKYITYGFICVSSGSPGTWRELRCLTGN
jgi:hypothetical protein